MSVKADLALDYLMNRITPDEFNQVFAEVLRRLPMSYWANVVLAVVAEMRQREARVPVNGAKP